ncbi:MAG TPA: ATP-binding protein [Polyangiaceae bacterium]|nr:ATP-binding protein [Polyangiaceae bacterium]
MNAATALSLIATAIDLVIGFLALAFGAAPGWKHFKTFAFVAFSAALYSAGDAFFAAGNRDPVLIPWFGRTNAMLACFHCAAWIVYAKTQYAQPFSRASRVTIAGLALVGVLALIPGVVMTDTVVTQTIGWANVSYQIAPTSWFGSLVVPLIPLTLLGPALLYYRKAREGAPGARTHLVGFSLLFASGINEVLVALNVFQNLYLADVGFLAAVLSVSAEMTYRVTRDARDLQALSAELSRQVEERTRELGDARDNLIRAERLAALGRLSASVGHEINNPLSYVIGNLEYAYKELERSGSEPALLEALRDASSGADRIRKIVHELRAFSRGSDTDRRVLVDVREVLEAAVKLVWGELRHRVHLERLLSPVPPVVADPNRLTQVFVNVLMNAVQAIPEERAGQPGSIITLRTRATDAGEIAIEISDTGVGIATQDRARLFEPFFSTKPQDKGTGLGLFVSLGIVSSLGGRIDLESRVGEGTLVRIVLPVDRGVAPEPERISSIPPPSLRDRRLLVVDDDVLVARTLARLLSGHRVEVVGNGREALARLTREGPPFDLVLCDLMMPDLTGMDVYEEIEKNHPSLADRFVFISGGGVTERSRKFIELHADRVLAKPIDSRQLSKLLAQRVGSTPAGNAPSVSALAGELS